MPRISANLTNQQCKQFYDRNIRRTLKLKVLNFVIFVLKKLSGSIVFTTKYIDLHDPFS